MSAGNYKTFIWVVLIISCCYTHVVPSQQEETEETEQKQVLFWNLPGLVQSFFNKPSQQQYIQKQRHVAFNFKAISVVKTLELSFVCMLFIDVYSQPTLCILFILKQLVIGKLNLRGTVCNFRVTEPGPPQLCMEIF